MKFIGVTETKINGENKNVIIKFEGAGGKFTYEQLKGYKNAQFECSVKEKNNELWNATILDENDPFNGYSGKLYEHIVKSSMDFDKCSLYPELIINKEIEKENVEMRKYKVGDKVVIRKDLKVDEFYGDYWHGLVEFMKKYDYAVIDKVDSDGDYWLKDYDKFVCVDMIEGLYVEEKDMKIEAVKHTINISNTMKPKKLHVVELKNGKIFEVPFGKLILVTGEFTDKDIEKYIAIENAVLLLSSDIRMMHKVKV